MIKNTHKFNRQCEAAINAARGARWLLSSRHSDGDKVSCPKCGRIFVYQNEESDGAAWWPTGKFMKKKHNKNPRKQIRERLPRISMQDFRRWLRDREACGTALRWCARQGSFRKMFDKCPSVAYLQFVTRRVMPLSAWSRILAFDQRWMSEMQGLYSPSKCKLFPKFDRIEATKSAIKYGDLVKCMAKSIAAMKANTVATQTKR